MAKDRSMAIKHAKARTCAMRVGLECENDRGQAVHIVSPVNSRRFQKSHNPLDYMRQYSKMVKKCHRTVPV